MNELTGFTSITRKGLLSLSDYDSLCKTVNLKIKGGMNDSNYGRSAHSGGCRTHSSDNAVHSQKIHQPRQIRRRDGGRSLACQARSFKTFCREPDQTGEQINKAGINRQTTTNNLVATDLSLTDCGPEEISLSTRYLIFSIDNTDKSCQVLHGTMLKDRVRVESVYVPMSGKYPINVHTYLDTVHDEIAIIRTSLVNLCKGNFCAAIILDDMYYRGHMGYDYPSSDQTYKTTIPKLASMTSGLFDEQAVIEALEFIASEHYANITVDQDKNVAYQFHFSTLEHTIDFFWNEPEPSNITYTPDPLPQKTPIQLEPQRARRSEAKAVKFHNKRAEIVALPATLTLEQWQQTLRDFNNKCAYCPTGEYEVLEHFIPLIFGGGTTEYNCVPACSSCNSIKSDQHPSMMSASSGIAEGLQRVKQYLETRKIGS